MPRLPRGPESVTGRRREGAAIFVDVLTRFAQDGGDAAVSAVAARAAAPVRVAVGGRPGVGRATLTRALACAEGIRIAGGAADVAVVVVAESVKPEDRSAVAAWREAGVPVLVVCNKADRTGAGPQEALRRAAGAPVVPAVALLAGVTLDDEAAGALRALAAEPADLSSHQAFLDCAHPLPRDVRLRLLRLLDRNGVAHAVAALRDGADAGQLPSLLRGLSGVDGVLAEVDTLAAPVRYRRVRAAVTELQALATGSPAVADFLAGDDAVLAAMTAAVDVVQAAGLRVDAGDDPATHLRRAVRWRAYSRGPVGPLHRACGADICRGSLRLLGRHR
ncbi:hypothetical protein [Mycolicibacterium litorale]|uniref:Uncharacterized protein n=1 Tax=Mycolicibacterium litorale TaxID=758802 RepID=A0AAD1MW58_9MYCO|nr:hypothetical protein [Mycolicibacterium litorale]MCV7417185.1 hypothetical protein [Mycolicibacterium litorale]TDY04973.1 hypothetical protein BCL50_3755 [Mycolicibacterium litorale]BBY18403.1 hypothetical protein MLIT_39950 [Mycolicibacterium litorale]